MMQADLAGRLTRAGHVLYQRVYFEDTDFSGLVYHARYLHFLERGRSDWLRLLGVHHRDLAAEGLAFAVRRMEIDFLRPARIDDVLAIETRRQEIGGARIALRQSVRCDGDILVEALVTAALVGPAGRSACRRRCAPLSKLRHATCSSAKTIAVVPTPASLSSLPALSGQSIPLPYQHGQRSGMDAMVIPGLDPGTGQDDKTCHGANRSMP